MKVTLTKGWALCYINGATMYEFQVGRYWWGFLKGRYWWVPRRHWLTGRWEFPRVIQFGVEGGD